MKGTRKLGHLGSTLACACVCRRAITQNMQKVFSVSRGRHVLPVPLARSFVDAEIDLTGRSLPLEGGELLFGDGSAHARLVRGVIYMLSTYFSRRRRRCAAPPLLLTLLRCFCADALGRPRFISRLSHPFLLRFFLSLSLFRAVPQEIRSPCTGASPKRLAGEQRKNWPLPRSGGSCPPLSVRKHVFCLCVVARLARIVVRKSEAVDAEGWSLGPHVHCKPWSVLKEKVATAYD